MKKRIAIQKIPKGPALTFHFVSLFPDAFTSYLGESIIKRAIEDGVLAAHFYNPRDFSDAAIVAAKEGRPSTYAERRVDDKPYAGGPGMVMEALPVIRSIEAALSAKGVQKNKGNARIIFLYPDAKQFSNKDAEALALSTFTKKGHIIIVCGRYEGIDERAYEYCKKKYAEQTIRFSIGPYVLTGGELPAMIIMDTIARNIPGVLGNIDSLEQHRTASSAVYTRPESFTYKKTKLIVPQVLLSGNHADIEAWRAAHRDDTNA